MPNSTTGIPPDFFTTAAQECNSCGVPDSTVVGVLVSFLAAVLVYAAKQNWERRKLKRALVTEIQEMEGIESCAKQMNRVSSPPTRQLSEDDVPSPGSIPTTIYESNALDIGLLGGFSNDDSELVEFVELYSQVLRYKAIIADIRSGGETSNSDQEDLYDNIGDVSEKRDDLLEKYG
ncbi:hypothetical protein [Haloarchaeobius sp. DT45]|uniref:hypothetical protein n=1 Tax=Haloarchaeobius sp. DT45 TaxID=3446116 RepID=UPI003F6CC6B3